MTEGYSAADPILQPPTPNQTPTKPPTAHNIFVGPNGIRAGWRLVIFLALDFAFVYAIVHIPGVRSLLPSQQIFTAKGLLLSEGLLNLLPLLLAAAVMTFIEKRSFADYGMPLQEAFGKRFWQGVPLGFIMLSILLLLIGALHGFSIDGVGVGGTAALSLAILYFIGFILVGLFEVRRHQRGKLYVAWQRRDVFAAVAQELREIMEGCPAKTINCCASAWLSKRMRSATRNVGGLPTSCSSAPQASVAGHPASSCPSNISVCTHTSPSG